MKTVPLLEPFTDPGSRLDIKAIYRRPGQGINLTSGLPLRRHSQWVAKGFTYVSLATTTDVNEAGSILRSHGINPSDFQGAYTSSGAFDVPSFVREVSKDEAARIADIRAKVEKFGAEAVVEMMRLQDPSFELPPDSLDPVAAGMSAAAKSTRASGKDDRRT